MNDRGGFGPELERVKAALGAAGLPWGVALPIDRTYLDFRLRRMGAVDRAKALLARYGW